MVCEATVISARSAVAIPMNETPLRRCWRGALAYEG
jgi:hypothetical protein